MEEKIIHSVNKQISTEDFIDFLGSENSARLPEMAATRVIPSFLTAAKRYGIRSFSDDALRTWVVAMVIQGMKFNQVKRYVGALHTVYSDWNADGKLEDPFPSLIAELATPIEFDAKTAADNVAGLHKIFEIEPQNEKKVLLNVFLYLLYDVEAEFEDVVRLPIEYGKYDCQQISDLIARIPRKQRASYAFPLRQGNTTDKKIIATLQDGIAALLKNAGISPAEGHLRESVRSLWISKAIGSGINLATIRGMMHSMPDEYKILNLIHPATLTQEEKSDIICRVANHINDTAVRWFIMRMRHKVTPDEVKDEIKKTNETIYDEMDFYYPVYQTLEIDKNKKRKIVDNPYLPGILFIRLRSDKVDYLVRKLTKFAWCYRWTRDPGSPYSSMSLKQMEAFRMHIDRLTPDIRLQLDVREEPFEPDTEVTITGGDRMVGHTGRITSVRNADGTRTYSLEITSNVTAKWTVADIDEAFLKPV